MENKAEIDQQRNDSKIKALNEKLDSNQTKVENQLYNFEHTLKDKIDDLSVQKTPSENELKTIHEGIVSNTVKIMAETELQRVRYESLEKKYDLLR